MPETTDDLRERYAAAMRTAFRQWASTDDDACNSHEVGEHFAIAAAAVRDAEVERLRAELAEARAAWDGATKARNRLDCEVARLARELEAERARTAEWRRVHDAHNEIEDIAEGAIAKWRQRAEQAEAERDAAYAAIARVRELHSPETDPRRMPDCKGCRTVATITPYESCRTIAALDASSTEETADGC